MTKLEQNGVFRGLKIVSKTGKGTITQFVLVQSGNETFKDKNSGIVFQGEFGLVTLDGNNKLQNMYLGDGVKLVFEKVELNALNNKTAGAFIDFTGASPAFKVNGKFSVRLQDGSTKTIE